MKIQVSRNISIHLAATLNPSGYTEYIVHSSNLKKIKNSKKLNRFFNEGQIETDVEKYTPSLKPFYLSGNDKCRTYKNFTDFNCKGDSIAPLIDYANNPICQELTMEEDYLKNPANKCLHINLRDSNYFPRETEWLRTDNSNLNLYVMPKSSAVKKIKLGVFGHSMGKYYLNADKERS